MSSYTLNYFNQRGRAEICRMLFAAADVQYNDKRYEISEWGNVRNIPEVGDINISSERRMSFQESCRRILPYMERSLEMRNGGNKWFMGDQFTMADMMCYCCIEKPMMEDHSFLSSYPKLVALRTRVMNHPKLSPHLQKRCRTDF